MTKNIRQIPCAGDMYCTVSQEGLISAYSYFKSFILILYFQLQDIFFLKLMYVTETNYVELVEHFFTQKMIIDNDIHPFNN